MAIRRKNNLPALTTHPHDALEGVLVEELALLGRLLQPEHEPGKGKCKTGSVHLYTVHAPGAGDPVGVELIGGDGLEQLLLIHCHES